MADIILQNRAFRVQIDPGTGAVTRLAHPADPHGMNWVNSPDDNPWHLASHAWGLGFLSTPTRGITLHRWQQAAAVRATRAAVTSRYRAGGFDLTVTRRLRATHVEESYVFRNPTRKPLPLWGAGLYVPFNDNYPDAATCLARRCNAHLWCGGATTYACCLRMGAEAPHLGLVLTEGQVSGYSIENRGLMLGGSNTRGTIAFIVGGFTLPPGGRHRLAWRLFWHQGWDDFLAQAAQVPGFVRLAAERYTFVRGQKLEVTASARSGTALWNGQPVRAQRAGGALRIARRVEAAGEQTVTLRQADGRETWIKALAIEPVATLVRRRAAFIRDRQQVTDRRSPVHGALLSYDNALEARFRNPEWPDQDEGRERVGMGVLLAQSLRRWRDPKTVAAAQLFHRFVRGKLQTPDGTVNSAVNDRTQRLYNYPWVAQFHLEMWRAFGAESYLEDFCRTMHAYYRRGGERFYAIGVPIADGLAALHLAGWRREERRLEAEIRRHADTLVANGLAFPPHEVNYEQTIVGPAVLIPLEAYLATGEERYLEHVRRLLPCLDAFNGLQPDYRLHQIAIRHWDGFWFGGRRTWGDTFPHYWSAASGFAYSRYWQATGDAAYREKARAVLMNNLCSFGADGRARCVYIYPDAVNGNPGRFWDPLANDQDWAMVFLLQAAEIDPDFERACWR